MDALTVGMKVPLRGGDGTAMGTVGLASSGMVRLRNVAKPGSFWLFPGSMTSFCTWNPMMKVIDSRQWGRYDESGRG